MHHHHDALIYIQELAEVGRLLQSVHSPPLEDNPPPDGIGRCNYDDLCQLREEAPQAARRYFTVQNFLKVCTDVEEADGAFTSIHA